MRGRVGRPRDRDDAMMTFMEIVVSLLTTWTACANFYIVYLYRTCTLYPLFGTFDKLRSKNSKRKRRGRENVKKKRKKG